MELDISKLLSDNQKRSGYKLPERGHTAPKNDPVAQAMAKYSTVPERFRRGASNDENA